MSEAYSSSVVVVLNARILILTEEVNVVPVLPAAVSEAYSSSVVVVINDTVLCKNRTCGLSFI